MVREGPVGGGGEIRGWRWVRAIDHRNKMGKVTRSSGALQAAFGT